MNTRAFPLAFGEFVLLAAALMATQAVAVDAMLPALPTIVRELRIADANRAQLIVTVYVAGAGIGQLFWGLMADRFGRRPALLAGLALYVLAAVSCGLSASFEALLAWRLVHGLAAASAVITRSVIRDQYSGRQLARIMSLTFVVFLMVPVIAPSLGQAILLVLPWRYVFAVFGVYASAVWLWTLLRLPETLRPENRVALTGRRVLGAVRIVLSDRTSLYYSLAVAVMFGSLLAYVGMIQQIFATQFHAPNLMPAVFALCAISMGAASLLNAKIVGRIGMRRISHAALLAFIATTAVHAVVAALRWETLWTFVVLQSATMALFSLTASNFGAMALEPVGAIAGIGASLQGFITTTGGALVAAAIGSLFNGTTVPLAAGAMICGLVSFWFAHLAERGRPLFSNREH